MNSCVRDARRVYRKRRAHLAERVAGELPGFAVGENLQVDLAGTDNVLGPRMNVTIFPSGDSAGWVTESGRFVIWIQSEGPAGLVRGHTTSRVATVATRASVASAAYVDVRRRGADPAGASALRPLSTRRWIRFRSARSSDAVCQRISRSFSSAFAMMFSSSIGN